MNEQNKAGMYEVKFVANNIPCGVYFYELRSGIYIDTKKMVLLP
jgi:hypothetical protein